MKRIRFAAAAALALAAGAAHGAVTTQPPAALAEAARRYIAAQTRGLPGAVRVRVTPPDNRLRLPRCADLAPSVPPGERLWGHTAVTLTCRAPSPWRVTLSAVVEVTAPVLTSTRGIVPGQTIQSADLASETTDLTRLPAGVLTDPAQAVGRVAAAVIPAGSHLRADQLRAAWVVRAGQRVPIRARGDGFEVSTEGTALSGASPGQTIAFRLPSGRQIRATVAADGKADVAY